MTVGHFYRSQNKLSSHFVKFLIILKTSEKNVYEVVQLYYCDTQIQYQFAVELRFNSLL